MRSALFNKLPFLLLLVAVAHCQGPPPQQVNPHTQIRWPINCSGPNMIYNYAANRCIAAPDASALTPGPPAICPNSPSGGLTATGCTLQPTQVVWPGTCTSGVYSPAANACVPPGTAANAAGNLGEIQYNIGGGILGAVVKSAVDQYMNVNYPAMVTAPNVNTPMATGYKQNAGNPGVPSPAIAHNRDQTTAVFATPQDFCVNSGSGPPFDDTPCFNKAIRWLASQNNNAAKTLYVPWTANGYYLANNGAQFLYTLPYDFGDYHGSAGSTTLASASVYFTSGKLTSCAVQGGSGYAPNAELPIQILDPQHLGSGAAAYVLTDATGTPAPTCVVQQPGMNYPQVGVIANVIPLGGDGAAGTCSLNTNTFAATCTVTSGGFGYNSAAKPQANMAGLTCTGGYPALTLTFTGVSLTGVTTTAGGSCTYTGPACGTPPCATASVPFQIGASCGGVQCTILPMQTPVNIPLSVALLSGIQIVGVGDPVITSDYGYIGGSPSLTNAIAFGDPWGDQAGGSRADLSGDMTAGGLSSPPYISNITVNAQINFAFPLLSGGIFDRITCGLKSLCYLINNTQQTAAGTFRAPDAVFSNGIFLGVTGFFIAGNWSNRSPDTAAGGNFGGTFMGHTVAGGGMDTLPFGQAGGIDIENFRVVYPPFSTTAWDTFFEQYFWQPQNSPAAPRTDASHLLSHGSPTVFTCPTTQTFATRATDDNFGYVGTYNAYSWFNCYRGIGNAFVSALPRYSTGFGFTNFYPNQVGDGAYSIKIRQGRINGEWRPLFMGRAQKLEVSDIFTTLSNAGADPYLPTGSTNAFVWEVAYSNTNNGSVTDILSGVIATGLKLSYYGTSTTTFSSAAMQVRNVTGFPDQYTGAIIPVSFSTTAVASEPVAMTGIFPQAKCQLTPTNAAAATNITSTFINGKTNNQVTLNHVATAGMTYDIFCTRY